MTSVLETFGLACHKCKRDDCILVEATELVRLVEDGTVSASDQEWSAESTAICEHCGYTGIVAEFDPETEATAPTLLVSPPASKTSVPNDVCCELAHELTVRECSMRGIPVDALDMSDEDETHYSDEAQQVFDAVSDVASRVLEPYCEEVAP